MQRLWAWLADVYQRYGWEAVLVIVVILTLLAVGVVRVLEVNPAALWDWLNTL